MEMHIISLQTMKLLNNKKEKKDSISLETNIFIRNKKEEYD